MRLNDFIYWIDANLPPKVIDWLNETFGVTAEHVFNLGFISAGDDEIFEAAKKSADKIIVITKDEDFVDLVLRKKIPSKNYLDHYREFI